MILSKLREKGVKGRKVKERGRKKVKGSKEKRGE